MKPKGLGSQIAWTMIFNAIVIIVIVLFGTSIFYYLLSEYWPNLLPKDYFSMPTAPEWVWFIFTTVTALVIAIFVSVKLSNKIIEPLNSVINGINQLSEGDLSIRAIECNQSLGEIAILTRNFNSLAQHLELMTQEQSFWNAAIAHELRTPVTILKGRIQGLADGVFEAEQKQFQSLLTQVDSLIRIIEDLRVISLAESGHLDLKVQKTNIAAEITTVVDFLAPKFISANKHIITNLSPSSVVCDPFRIRQVVIAILDNCLKYSNQGKIYINTHITDTYLIISIEDEGPGISPEFLPFVFTAFRREKKEKHTGSGLGLAVVDSIIKAHQGKISCCINSLGGTRFDIYLPV